MKQPELQIPSPILALLTPDEIFAGADQSLLSRLTEDRRIEFKSSNKIDRVRLGEYYSMWANTKGAGGLIVIGIENDGTVSGCLRLTSTNLNDIEKIGKTICPDCREEIKRTPILNSRGVDDFVLIIRVPYCENKVIRTTAGKAFIRIGDEKTELSEDQIRELQMEKRELDLEHELDLDSIWPDDFDSELLETFCASIRAKWNLTRNQTNEQILQHRRLGKFVNKVFIPNNACTLVFARDPMGKFPGCNVRFLRYRGEFEVTGENYNVEKDIPIEGSIPKLIVGSAAALESQLRDFTVLGENAKFYTIPEYPRSAWYEALVNACVHRSYGIKTRPIFIKMFDDKLVIESPGGFPGAVTPQNIYHSHNPRNPAIMDALKYLDFVKCHNEGTRRMRDTMAESKLPLPEFEQKTASGGSYSVRVTLQNNIKFRKAAVDASLSTVLSESLLQTLTERERMVLNFVAKNREINVSQCQKQLEFARWHTAANTLKKMVGRGLLRYEKLSAKERGKSRYVLPAAIPIPKAKRIAK